MEDSANGEPFPVVLEVDAERLDGSMDLFGRLRREEVHGVRVRRAFDPKLVARVVERLEARAFAVKSAAAPPEGEPVQLFGLPVQWATPDLKAYLRAAAELREALGPLWSGFDYEGRIRSLLGALCGDPAIEVMRAGDASLYTPSTIRRVAPGGGIPPHAERHQLEFPGCHDLRTAIDAKALLSFFTLLAPGDAGGRLAVHAMTTDDFARAPEAASGQRELRAALARHRCGEIRLEAGDLVVFNSGRYFHEVTSVHGHRNRWTIGGFLAPSPEGDHVFYWG